MSVARWEMRHLGREQDDRPRQPMGRVYGRLVRYVWAEKVPLIGAFLCVSLVSLLNLVTPQLMRLTIDHIIPSGQLARLWWVVAAILMTAAATGLFQYGHSYLMSMVGQRAIYTIRNALYQHIQNLSMSFFDNRRTGELMSRVTNDVNSLQQLITSGIADIVTDVFTFVAIAILLLVTDWQLTLFLLLTFPIMISTTRHFSRRIRGAYRAVQEEIAHVNEHLQETIASIRVVKSFANEDYEVGRFSERNRRSMEANLNAVRLWSVFFPLLDVLNQLSTVVVLAFGARQVMLGRLSVGALVAFVAYLQQLQRPIRRFGRVMNVIQQGGAAAERIFEILDTQPDVQEKPDAVPLPRVKGHIRFEHVTFSYDGQRNALTDFNLEIEPGMTVALVGPSGAGKSTVANLLARFYDPQEGRVLVDGYDVRDVTLASLRRQMGIVSQEILLLHGSVRENIAYGKPEAARAEVEEAARAANAHDFIMSFPQGYDSPIGERGIRLSGGQRQRIAIARAILKDPRILILDEATSQLDSEAEHLIQEALYRLLQGRTSLVIAHRLSTIRRADLIVVLDKGRIVEQGTHDELLAKGGRYAELHSLQFPLEEPEAPHAVGRG